MSHTNTDVRRLRIRRGCDAVAYTAPFAVIATLLVTYLLNPQFYLRYVLELHNREYQAVELATVGCLAVAVTLLVWAARRQFRSERSGSSRLELIQRHGASIFIAGMALATLFFLGEETNWGQNFLHWGKPAIGATKPKVQTNLHNNLGGIPIQTLGSVAMGAAFFVVPLLWARRDRLRLPQQWRAAVAEGPVIVALAVAFVWQWFKDAYVVIAGKAPENRFYWNFVEQINEQKELLVALSLMLYGIYRIVAVSKPHAPSPVAPVHRERPAEADFSVATRR